MRVEARRDEQQLGLEALDRRRDQLVEHAEVLGVAAARGNGTFSVVARCSSGPPVPG